jgi:hypothetical protein
MPSLDVSIDRQNIDARSSEIQCALRIKNMGDKNIHLISIRTSSASGTRFQRALDTSLEDDRKQLNVVYKQLTGLLRRMRLQRIGASNKGRPNMFRSIFEWYQLRRPGSSSYVRITDSREAQEYHQIYDNQTRESDPVSQARELDSVFTTKLNAAQRLETRLGISQMDITASMTEHLADIEPQDEFVKHYVIKCPRKLFVSTTYTLNFDVRYQVGGSPVPLNRSESFPAVISPNPFTISVAAAAFSVLGLVLKVSLDMLKNVNELTLPVIQEMFESGPMILSLVASVVTAILFYNIYEWTELGRRLDSGVGWRSALIIGGICGLLNQKVVAAFEELFG